MTIASVADLVSWLQQARALESSQLEELTGSLQDNFADPRSLAQALVQRDWLTRYQVQQLFEGQGQDLVLGNFLLLDRLGEGGMGQVFKARHQKLRHVVALKVLQQNRVDSPEFVRRFKREIRATAEMSHPWDRPKKQSQF